MKTCFNTITAGRDKPLEEIIMRSGQAGFDGLEIDQNHIADCLKRVPIRELKSRLEEASLQAVSIMAFNLAPFDDPGPGIAKIKEGAEYAHDFGAPLLFWQGIDPSQAAREFGKRIFLLHAKDTKLYRDRIQNVGYCGNWREYRLPGRGEMDWRQFLGCLAGDTGYTGFISIEHEDTEFGWPNGPVELRKEGLLKGLATLRESLRLSEPG